jgi:hypothetical protein
MIPPTARLERRESPVTRISYQLGPLTPAVERIDRFRIVNCGAAGFLLALVLHKSGFARPIELIETSREALKGNPEPFFPGDLSKEQQTLVEPLVIKEWSCCLLALKQGVRRERREIWLLSLEQLAVEAHETLPTGSIRIAAGLSGRSLRQDRGGTELSIPPPSSGKAWAHSSLWQLEQSHGLAEPVLADRSIATDKVLQYLPLSETLLLVRQLKLGDPPMAPAPPAGGKLLSQSMRPLRPHLAAAGSPAPTCAPSITDADLAGDLVRAAFAAAQRALH